ncbi:MAG: phosphohydrolase [Lachnospiraceae bacterium]|nr:phosphohydrolase [Lachnospiraceae bacterium]
MSHAYKAIRNYGKDILRDQGFRDSGNSVQHGTVSVRQHCISVASHALAISRFLPIKFCERELVRGALLHDYFLYDWHDKEVKPEHILVFYKMHGFVHPRIALANARRKFELTKREEDIIAKHMWPLTVKPPVCREAWVVTMADKYCSLLETLRIHKGRC